MDATLAVSLAAALGSGVLAGASLDQSLKQLPARHVAVIAYVAMACGALATKPGDFPGFDAHLLWLIGISHATYVGGKIPTRA